MSVARRQIVVVGGGISGLATAWHLSRMADERNLAVVVLESGDQPGGTARTDHISGYSLETGPNGFLDNKPNMLALCEAVGLKDRLVRANEAAANRYIFLGDRLRLLPGSPGAFLKSDLLSWRGKLRVLLERFVQQRQATGEESIYDFGCRRIGREATEVLLDAFVTGVLAGDPKLLSLPACFPRIVELERDYGSLLRAQGQLAKERRAQRGAAASGASSPAAGSPGGRLTAPQGGMGTLVQRLVDELGAAVQCREPICRLERLAAGDWVVHGDHQKQWQADAVVLACPAYAQADMIDSVEPEMAADIRGIPYTCAVIAVLGFPRSKTAADLNGFGYLTPERLGRSVLGVLWSSSIFPDQAPADCVQFRAILGGWRRPDVLDWNDSRIVDEVREDLKLTLGITAIPSFSWIHRWPRAIPQYHVGHLERLRRIEQRRNNNPGLFLGGNAYRGVSLNDCARDAENIAREVAAFVSRPNLPN